MLFKISFLLFFSSLMLGVCCAASIAVVVDEERLCAELAASGLGGGACGPPPVLEEGVRRWRRQSNDSAGGGVAASSSASTSTASSRRDICPVLCTNGLGHPLCGCKQIKDDEPTKANFSQVCGFFCSTYSLHVSGCPPCTPIALAPFSSVSAVAPAADRRSDSDDDDEEIDWEAWCKEMCSSGDGGIACNCDILPLSASLT